jgi:hypothetical protein
VWINSSTLLKRQNLAFEISLGAGAALRSDPWRLMDEKRQESIREGKGIAGRTVPARLLVDHLDPVRFGHRRLADSSLLFLGRQSLEPPHASEL